MRRRAPFCGTFPFSAMIPTSKSRRLRQPNVSRVRGIVPRRTPRRQVELEIRETEADLVGAVAAEERSQPAARGRRGLRLALVQFLEDHARRGG